MTWLRGGARRRERRRRLGECNRKARYLTEGLAEAALNLLREAGKERGVQHVYECTWCDGFHIGRMP